MNNQISKYNNFKILLPTFFLIIVSLLTLRSISTSTEIGFSMAQQLIGVVFGLTLAGVSYVSGRDIWFKLATPIFWFNVLLLVLVFFIGDVAQGSQRWISIGSFRLQPSELMKFSLILLQAKLLANKGKQINTVEGFGLSLFYLMVPVGLVAVQPDLGTAIVYVALWAAMLGVSEFSKKKIAMFGLISLVAIPLSVPLLADYQRERVTSFLNSSSDLQGQGYNVAQARITIGNGGWTGQGFDAGSQSQLEFLPSQHTDFIFAVIAEKIGFIGAALVIIAFLYIATRLIWLGWLSRNRFVRYALVGGGVLLAIEFIINIGMNLGLLPVTGLPLPFVSYGGSHVVNELILLGFCLGLIKGR